MNALTIILALACSGEVVVVSTTAPVVVEKPAEPDKPYPVVGDTASYPGRSDLRWIFLRGTDGLYRWYVQSVPKAAACSNGSCGTVPARRGIFGRILGR